MKMLELILLVLLNIFLKVKIKNDAAIASKLSAEIYNLDILNQIFKMKKKMLQVF